MYSSRPRALVALFSVGSVLLCMACGNGEDRTASISDAAPADGTVADSSSTDGTANASDAVDGTSSAMADAIGDSGEGDASLNVDAIDAGSVSLITDSGAPIGPFAFGQNYWDWVDWSNTGVTGMTGTEAEVKSLHLSVLRAGGDNNDSNSPSTFDTAQIDKFVAYCRAVGAEPILQVPIVSNGADGGLATAQTAADMVTYANGTKGYGVKYWEIGNEPDLYSTVLGTTFPIQTAADYCTYFHNFATAMRTANATVTDGGVAIQILGPELSWKYLPPTNDWLTPFLQGCKEDVDIVTIHRYPFSGTQVTVNGALTDATSFRRAIQSVSAIVTANARPGTPLGVTEANISYDYDPTKYSDAAQLAEPGTFYAAMWTADALGVALETNLWTLAFWNLAEADTSGSILGFVNGGQPVPAYYAQEMISANFQGNVLAPTGVPANFSVYAAHDSAGGSTSALVVNKTSRRSSVNLTIDGNSPTTVVVSPLSLTLVQIPDAPDGGPLVTEYTMDLADAGLSPRQVPQQ